MEIPFLACLQLSVPNFDISNSYFNAIQITLQMLFKILNFSNPNPPNFWISLIRIHLILRCVNSDSDPWKNLWIRNRIRPSLVSTNREASRDQFSCSSSFFSSCSLCVALSFARSSFLIFCCCSVFKSFLSDVDYFLPLQSDFFSTL